MGLREVNEHHSDFNVTLNDMSLQNERTHPLYLLLAL